MATSNHTPQNFGKERSDSIAAHIALWTKGMQEIATTASDYSKKSFEESRGHAEKLLGSKSLEDAIHLQTEFVKQCYDGFVAQSAKVGELYKSFFQEAAKPALPESSVSISNPQSVMGKAGLR